VKWGVDVRRERFDTVKGTPFFGQEIYGASFTSSSNAPGSGLPFADFLLGYPASRKHSHARLGTPARHLLRRLRAGRLEGHPEADFEPGRPL